MLKRGFFIVLGISVFMLLISSVKANIFAISEKDLPNFYTGPIASTNGDWILSGHWMAYTNQSSPKDSGFHSMFQMVMANGSASHIHTIGNATDSSINKEGNNTILKSNISITMKNGPVLNVPTIITISNNNTIAIQPDPSKISNHFGNSTIKGLVSNYNITAKMTEMMINDPEAKKIWNPLMDMSIINNMMKNTMTNGNNMTILPSTGNKTLNS